MSDEHGNKPPGIETSEPPSLRNLRPTQLDFVTAVTGNARLSGMTKAQFLYMIGIAWEARDAVPSPHELKANEPHEPQLVYDDELKELEPLYPDAVAFANSEARMSISKMQRKFTLGYNRAARIMERLASDGVLVFNNMTGEYRRSSSEGEHGG